MFDANINDVVALPSNLLCDVSLMQSSIPPTLEGATSSGVLWQAAPNRFLFNVPNVARYLVEDGRRILIDPLPDVDNAVVIYFLRMSPLAALLYQKGLVALHAAIAVNDGGAVLLAGNSGAGKSTTLAALSQRNWVVFADDIAMVTHHKGKPVVYQMSPHGMLWPRSLEKLNIDAKSLPFADNNRQIFSISQHSSPVPRQLRTIYYLSVHNKDDISIAEISGTLRFKVLSECLYNSHIADVLLDRGEFMRFAASTQSVVIKRLQRPSRIWSAEMLADLIEKDVS